MKKQFLLVAFIVACTTMTFAQGGGFQRRTVEERVKTAHEKIDSAFKLEAAVMTKIDTMFTYYFKGQDAIREELMSGGARPDFQVFQEKMKPLNDAKDTQLKGYLGEDNFKIYKDKVEPLFMRRPGGGGGQGPRSGGNR
jgi:protein CpxP